MSYFPKSTFATAAQGGLASSALQSGDLGTATGKIPTVPLPMVVMPTVKVPIDKILLNDDSAAYHPAAEFALAATLNTHTALFAAHGRLASSLTLSITTTNIEKQIIGLTIPANTLRAKSIFHLRAFGNFAMSLNLVSTSRGAVRIGPVSLLGTLPASVTVNNAKGLSGSAPFLIEGDFEMRSIGAAGQMAGRLCMWGGIVAPFNDDISPPVTAAVNTTIDNILELTYLTNNISASAVFDLALIEGG